MRIGLGVLSILLLLIFSSCSCDFDERFNSPERPSSAQGWKAFVSNGVNVKGDFVMTLGESTDNGKYGLRVIELTPAKCHILKEQELPKARIQIYDVKTQKTLCEDQFSPGVAFIDGPEMCGENFEWSGLGVSAINAKEKWVAFRIS
jgi:hypothetical protein